MDAKNGTEVLSLFLSSHFNCARLPSSSSRFKRIARSYSLESQAPIVMHRLDLANNRFATYSPPLLIRPEHRGLRPALVDALSRVRTDLDSFSPFLTDLLIAQAYFLTDAHIRSAMPSLVPAVVPAYWDWAMRRISEANANEANVLAQLKNEAAFILRRRA